MSMLSTSSPALAPRIGRHVPAKSMLLYHQNHSNACPGCGRSHWLVGRVMAQCAFCETALPLAHGWRFEGLTRL